MKKYGTDLLNILFSCFHTEAPHRLRCHPILKHVLNKEQEIQELEWTAHVDIHNYI